MMRRKGGQATVELALATVLLFGLLFAIIDLGVLFFVNLTMQNAVRTATRYAVTGQSGLDPNGGTDRMAALVQAIKDNSYGLYDKNLHNPKDPTVKVIQPLSGVFRNYTGGTVQTSVPGQPNDIIVVSLTYTWPLMTPLLKPLFPNGRYTFTVKSTMRNEPFSASGGS